MRCDDFQRRWQTLLDERQQPQEDAQLGTHAAECQACNDLLRVQSVLFREIERTKIEQARSEQARSEQARSVNLQDSQPGHARLGNRSEALRSISPSTHSGTASRVLHAEPAAGQFAKVRPARGQFSRRRQMTNAVILGLAVAGSLLVAVVPAWRLSNSHRPDRSTRSIVARFKPRTMQQTIWVAKTRASQPKHAAAKPVQPVAAAAGGTATKQADKKAHEQEPLRILMRNVAAKLSDVPEEQLESFDSIAGGFRPLANTLGAAWDALRRSLPVGGSQSLNDPQAILGWPGLVASPV